MPYTDIEFGKESGTSVTFSRAHSAAPTSVVCTINSSNSNVNLMMSALAFNLTNTGFEVRKRWRDSGGAGAASEPFFWVAIWN